MESDDAVRALGALAQASRLRTFRALVVAGAQGLTPGDISARLDIAPATLSFHLKELAHAGLVVPQRDGRRIVYRAAFDRMQGLLGFLTAHCCEGAACALDVQPQAACCAAAAPCSTPTPRLPDACSVLPP